MLCCAALRCECVALRMSTMCLPQKKEPLATRYRRGSERTSALVLGMVSFFRRLSSPSWQGKTGWPQTSRTASRPADDDCTAASKPHGQLDCRLSIATGCMGAAGVPGEKERVCGGTGRHRCPVFRVMLFPWPRATRSSLALRKHPEMNLSYAFHPLFPSQLSACPLLPALSWTLGMTDNSSGTTMLPTMLLFPELRVTVTVTVRVQNSRGEPRSFLWSWAALRCAATISLVVSDEIPSPEQGYSASSVFCVLQSLPLCGHVPFFRSLSDTALLTGLHDRSGGGNLLCCLELCLWYPFHVFQKEAALTRITPLCPLFSLSSLRIIETHSPRRHDAASTSQYGICACASCITTPCGDILCAAITAPLSSAHAILESPCLHSSPTHSSSRQRSRDVSAAQCTPLDIAGLCIASHFAALGRRSLFGRSRCRPCIVAAPERQETPSC